MRNNKHFLVTFALVTLMAIAFFGCNVPDTGTGIKTDTHRIGCYIERSVNRDRDLRNYLVRVVEDYEDYCANKGELVDTSVTVGEIDYLKTRIAPTTLGMHHNPTASLARQVFARSQEESLGEFAKLARYYDCTVVKVGDTAFCSRTNMNSKDYWVEFYLVAGGQEYLSVAVDYKTDKIQNVFLCGETFNFKYASSEAQDRIQNYADRAIEVFIEQIDREEDEALRKQEECERLAAEKERLKHKDKTKRLDECLGI